MSRSPGDEKQWPHAVSGQGLPRPTWCLTESPWGVPGKHRGQLRRLDPAVFSWLFTGLFLKGLFWKVNTYTVVLGKQQTATDRGHVQVTIFQLFSILTFCQARLLLAKRVQRHFVHALRANSLSSITGLGSESHQYGCFKSVNYAYKKKHTKKVGNIKVFALKKKIFKEKCSPMFKPNKIKGK